MEEMARSVLGDVMGMPSPDAATNTYEAYRTVEGLPPIAKALYSAAGEHIEFHLFQVSSVLMVV